jgi:hypothetical protein
MLDLLADHSALEALPFFAPMLLVVVAILVIVARDRRRAGS